MKIAIIGAGIAGLTLAHRLAEQHDVTVLEKARGPGGRMSTRRAKPYAFDHGAQYFTAESERFRAYLRDLQAQNIVAHWPEEIRLHAKARVSDKPQYVAQPGMNAICKTLASTLDVRTQIHATDFVPGSDGWWIETRADDRLGPYDWIISTAPAEQTAALMPADFSGQSDLARVRMSGCFALMLGFEISLDLPWQALKSGVAPIGWIAVNSQKPSRPGAYSLLIQSANDWADAHIEGPLEEVQQTLLRAASELTGLDLSAAKHQVLHRWRYASTPVPAGVPFLFDPVQRLAACGDWCLGSKVEAAYSSASALADEFQSLSKT
ncbi:MAG: FAD-dependent oxidoreductase [Pseudomonadota bacterium]